MDSRSQGEAAGLEQALPVRRKAIYSIIVTVFVIAGVELACRCFVAATPNARWNHHAQLVRMIGFGELSDILQPHDWRFWQLTPNVASKQLQGTISDSPTLSFRVSTDENGYRRGLPVSSAKATVLFLGDSCTFGVGVDDDQTFAVLVQQRLPGVRSRNCGVPGYSAYQGRLLLESYQLEPPNVVVVSFMFNDNSSWDQLSDLQHAGAAKSPSHRPCERISVRWP